MYSLSDSALNPIQSWTNYLVSVLGHPSQSEQLKQYILTQSLPQTTWACISKDTKAPVIKIFLNVYLLFTDTKWYLWSDCHFAFPLETKELFFHPGKRRQSESLARGWVSLLRCSSLVMINDKSLCSLESPLHTRRAHSKGGQILPSTLAPAWGPTTAPNFHSPQVKSCRNQVKCEKQLWIWNLDGRNLSFHWKGQNTCSGVAKLRKDILLVLNKKQVAPITAT